MKRMLIRFFSVAATSKIATMILPGSPGQLVERTERWMTILKTPVMRTERRRPVRRSWSSWSSWGPLSSAGWPSSRRWRCLSSAASSPGQYHGSASCMGGSHWSTSVKLCSLIGWHHLSFSCYSTGCARHLVVTRMLQHKGCLSRSDNNIFVHFLYISKSWTLPKKVNYTYIAGRKETKKRQFQEWAPRFNSGSIYTLGWITRSFLHFSRWIISFNV